MITPADAQRCIDVMTVAVADQQQVQRIQQQQQCDSVLCSPLWRQVQHNLTRHNLVQEARRSQHVVYADSLHSRSHGVITCSAQRRARSTDLGTVSLECMRYLIEYPRAGLLIPDGVNADLLRVQPSPDVWVAARISSTAVYTGAQYGRF